jgi:N4-gp56 family major capsid protein
VTDVTATAQKFGDFLFLNEEVDLINFNGQAEKLSEILGIQAGRSLNLLQRNVAEDNFTAVFVGTATTATGINGVASASGFFKAGDADTLTNTLDRNDASKFKPMTNGSQNIGTLPIRSAYCGITHPDIASGLRALTGFIEAQQYAGQTELFPDEVGFLRGIRFIETTEATIDVTTGVAATSSATTAGRSTATRFDVYSTVVYGKDALGSLGLDATHVKEVYQAGDRVPAIMMISHARGSAGVGDPLNELSSMGWKTWHAGVVLNSAWGRTFKSSAPLLDSNE